MRQSSKLINKISATHKHLDIIEYRSVNERRKGTRTVRRGALELETKTGDNVYQDGVHGREGSQLHSQGLYKYDAPIHGMESLQFWSQLQQLLAS